MDKSSDNSGSEDICEKEPITIRETPHSKRSLSRPSGQYTFELPKNITPSLESIDPELADAQQIKSSVRQAITSAMLDQMALAGGYDSLRPKQEISKHPQPETSPPIKISPDGK